MASNSRLKMFWLIILRALGVRMQRVLVIFVALTVGAAIVSAMSAIYFDVNTKMSKELRTYGANFYIGSGSSKYIDMATYNEILEQAPQGIINASSPYLYGVSRSDLEKIFIMGVQFDQLQKLAPYWQIKGSRVTINFDQRNVMLGKKLAERLELKIGDKISLTKNREKKVLNIKAIIEAGDASDNMLITNLALAQEWLDLPNSVTNILLSIDNDKGQVEQFAADLQAKYPELDIRPIRKVSVSEGQVLHKISGLMGLIAVVILILATLCVNTTLIALVRERAKEFALQKALGAKRIDIIKQIITEILIIAICAIIVGSIVGYILAQLLGHAVFNASIDLRLPVIPITILLTLLVTFIAVIIPTRQALQIETAQMLKGD